MKPLKSFYVHQIHETAKNSKAYETEAAQVIIGEYLDFPLIDEAALTRLQLALVNLHKAINAQHLQVLEIIVRNERPDKLRVIFKCTKT